MTDRLPPLNALRAFEVSARHLSFTRAAQELHVTPGAVSHQVKTLEEYLGVQLFHRGPQSLELTTAAAACLSELQAAFSGMARAVSRLADQKMGGSLSVSVAPAFAHRWLVPRLQRFSEAHPDIELKIAADLSQVDVVRRDAGQPRREPFGSDPYTDLTIRFGSGDYPDHEVDMLCETSVTPLCTPQFVKGKLALRRLEDLAHHTLLHDDTVYFDEAEPDWTYFLRQAGVKGVDSSRGPRFNSAILALSAAADGLGIALGMTKLAETELASGQLVTPFAFSLPSRHTYYLVRPKAVPLRAPAIRFRTWLLEEARCQEGQSATVS